MNCRGRRSTKRRRGRDLVGGSLSSLSAAVRTTISAIGYGTSERFGSRKVYISAIYAALARSGYEIGSLCTFKARLVLAHAADLIELARADFVPAMQRDAVAASESASSVSEFQFVIDRGSRDPWGTAA